MMILPFTIPFMVTIPFATMERHSTVTLERRSTAGCSPARSQEVGAALNAGLIGATAALGAKTGADLGRKEFSDIGSYAEEIVTGFLGGLFWWFIRKYVNGPLLAAFVGALVWAYSMEAFGNSNLISRQ